MKANVENPRDGVEKMSSKESVNGAHTVVRGRVRTPNGLPKENPKGGPHTAPQQSLGTQGTVKREQIFQTAPKIFNSYSDYHNQEVHSLADWHYPPADWLYFSVN